jgi:hypothetical protein
MKPTELHRGDTIKIKTPRDPIYGVFIRFSRPPNSKIAVEFFNLNLFDPKDGPYIDKLIGDESFELMESIQPFELPSDYYRIYEIIKQQM